MRFGSIFISYIYTEGHELFTASVAFVLILLLGCYFSFYQTSLKKVAFKRAPYSLMLTKIKKCHWHASG